MTGGRAPRRKGDRAEREFARLVGGRRVPLSGAAGGDYAGDVRALGLRWEVKRRAAGWQTLYGYLEGADALALRADRRGWLVVMDLDRFLKLVGGEAMTTTGQTEQDRPAEPPRGWLVTCPRCGRTRLVSRDDVLRSGEFCCPNCAADDERGAA